MARVYLYKTGWYQHFKVISEQVSLPGDRLFVPGYLPAVPGYRLSCWYLASVTSFCGFHHHSLLRYQSMVAARPAAKSS